MPNTNHELRNEHGPKKTCEESITGEGRSVSEKAPFEWACVERAGLCWDGVVGHGCRLFVRASSGLSMTGLNNVNQNGGIMSIYVLLQLNHAFQPGQDSRS
jgi:hypothetical protein